MAAYTFRATPGELAVLMAALAVSSMVGASIAGTLVDRFGPTRVLVGSQFFYVPVIVSITFVTSMDQLVAMSVLLGLSTAPIMTATSSFAPFLVRAPGEIEKVNSLLEGAGALSFVLGPAMGALIVDLASIDAVFYVDALLTTLGALLVLGVNTPPVRSHTRPSPIREIVEGLRISYGMRAVRYYVLMGTVMWFSFGAFAALEPLFYRDVVGTGVQTIGYMNSLFGLGIAFGAWFLTRLPGRFTSARSLSLGIGLMGFCAAIYVGTADLRVIAVGALVWGAAIGAVEPMLRTLMQLDTPEEYLGRVMGTAQVHRSAGEVLPLAVAPALAASFGVQPVMIGGALIATAAALASFGHAASIDRAGRVPGRRLRLDEALTNDDPLSPLT
jgi:MFS family permease